MHEKASKLPSCYKIKHKKNKEHTKVPFVKGMTKHPNAGVKKGQKQKPRIDRLTVAQLLDSMNIDCVKHLLFYASDKSTLDARDKVRIWMELLSYSHAKPRADMKIAVENPISQQNIEMISEVGLKIAEALSKWTKAK